MNGLILAAGEGRRLAADGIRQPKSLVEVGGQAQLPHLITTLRRLDCETVTCMVPFEWARELALLPIVASSPRITIIGCRTPSSLHTMALGLAAVAPGPVFCTMVDTVMREPDWTTLATTTRSQLASGVELTLAVTPYVDDERPLYVVRDAEDKVIDVSDTPVEPVAVTGGVYGLSDTARWAVREAIGRQTERLRHFLSYAARGALRVAAIAVPRIIDVDRARDVAAANEWLRGAAYS